MNMLAILAPILGAIALLFAAALSRKVSAQDAGTDRMKEIAAFIHEGVQAFLMAEYKILVVFVAVLFIGVGLGISWITAVAFLVGAASSTIAGYCGMNVDTKANVRTAATAKDSGMNKALSIAFSGGAVMGMCVVGLGLLGCGVVYLVTGDANVLSGFSLGASSIALFARVGGGIYTKAADVGADLVGKVEAGIPEDDPRNPATIADNVGDNVGDVAGMYTEMIFPQKGVRFIAINDGVDSAQGDNDFAPLRNIFNEWLVRDTSKKIKAVKRSKGMSGKPVTSKPVYGYLMDEDENFIIDEEAAPVVKQIYRLCLAGNGPTKIARMLTEQEIPTPGTLEYRRTGSTRRYHPGYECKWATNTVVHILENREYMGCLVNFKTEKPSYKTKHSIENPIEKQAIFENHHEPIIDTQTWERVQELRKQRKRPNRYDEVGLFSGMLFCADCGSVMYQQRYQTDKRKQDCYICGNYKKRTHDCTAHFIRTDLLTAGVLSNLRKVTSYAAKHEARFMKLLIEQNEDGGKRRNAAKKKELEAAEKRIGELSAIFKRLYEDSVSGRISDERFTELSADYEAEQQELKERVARIQAELSKAQEATVNAEKFMNIVRKHMNFEELTHTLLREFVEKIVVHECSYDENGTRRQDIEIYYSFVGKVDLPE